jgi:hypothetical protein
MCDLSLQIGALERIVQKYDEWKLEVRDVFVCACMHVRVYV